MDASLISNLLKLKRSVIPSGGGPTMKAPIVDWTEYQKRLPTEEEINHWIGNGLHPTLWGIVTGQVSNCVVFDADDQSAMDIFHKAGLNPHVKTKRGEHYYFKWPGHLFNNRTGIINHVDLRGDGGFVNCLGNNDLASYEMLIIPTDESLYDLTQLPMEVKEALKPGNQPKNNTNINPGEKIPQGQQDNWLFSKARIYRSQGDSEDMIFEKLKIDSLRCPQDNANPFTEKDFRRIAKSAFKYNPNTIPLPSEEGTRGIYIKEKKGILKGEEGITPPPRNAEAKPLQPVTPVTKRYDSLQQTKISREKIREYLVDSAGKWVFVRDLDNDLGIRTPEDKNARRQSVFQLIKSGLIERDPILDNKIRFVNALAGKITLSLDSLGSYLDIKFPFLLQNKVNIYPKNIILVAGSMNSGKTAFLLNVARMNKDAFPIVYFSSEMAEQELANRIMKFGEGLEGWQNVDFRERGHDFADVIRPDDFNIIDYIELNENIYLIGGMLEAIYNRLNKGIAIVAIQKKVGALFGRGQEFSAEKPRLYLSMDPGRLTIIKGKNWHDPKDNPNRQFVRFTLTQGCEFRQQGNWQRLEDD